MPNRIAAALLAVLLLLGGCAARESMVKLAWEPVEQDVRGQPIAQPSDLRYEVFVWVNDRPERKFGPVAEPRIDLPLRLRRGDVVHAQVVAIADGLRSERSEVISVKRR